MESPPAKRSRKDVERQEGSEEESVGPSISSVQRAAVGASNGHASRDEAIFAGHRFNKMFDMSRDKERREEPGVD